MQSPKDGSRLIRRLRLAIAPGVVKELFAHLPVAAHLAPDHEIGMTQAALFFDHCLRCGRAPATARRTQVLTQEYRSESSTLGGSFQGEPLRQRSAVLVMVGDLEPWQAATIGGSFQLHTADPQHAGIL